MAQVLSPQKVYYRDEIFVSLPDWTQIGSRNCQEIVYGFSSVHRRQQIVQIQLRFHCRKEVWSFKYPLHIRLRINELQYRYKAIRVDIHLLQIISQVDKFFA